MASMRDIKRRKESIQSTQQITKAMKLVSTVKLQKAKTRAESAKPYFLLCTELTGYMPEAGFPLEDMFRFYDKKGKEIPRWYDSYSGTRDGSSIAVAQGSIYKAE